MFTGIVEEVGKVRYIQLNGNSGVLAVKAAKVLEGTKIGDSIAVNGVCLTVTSLQPDGFTADVMAETIRRSSLGNCKIGSYVNLEPSRKHDPLVQRENALVFSACWSTTRSACPAF